MRKEFNQALAGYQREINRELLEFFAGEIKREKNPFLKKTLNLLKEFSLRPAKRIRPILVNRGYFLAGGKKKKAILRASLFIELIHGYLLIHDDIIDQDDLRRGGPTVHRSYGGFSKGKDHYGLSMAIAAGDMASALGYKILASADFPDGYKVRAIEKLNQIVFSTCCGQMLELQLRELGFSKKVKEKDILEIYRLKTALYSFVGPLQIGAMLAGAKEKFLKKIEKFALPLGIAFQIQDDIHEVFRPAEEIGKPVGSDIGEGQSNLLVLKTLEGGVRGKGLRKYLGRKNLRESELEKIKEIIIESGSLQYCREMSEKLVAQVEKNLIFEKEFPEKEKRFILSSAKRIISK